MPSEPDNSELEARLRELAPMVEAMHATEGQLPPEKTELLLKSIAEGTAKRKLQQSKYEAIWDALAMTIAEVPVELRKEWVKLPELFDKLPDPQSWLRAHLPHFEQPRLLKTTPAPACVASIAEVIPRPEVRYVEPVLRYRRNPLPMLLILAGAAGLVWMIGWLWMIGVLGGIGVLWLCSRLISPPRTAAESPVVAKKVGRPLSPSEARLPSHVELEELMEKSLQSLPQNVKNALRVNLIGLPELFKNTPDARQRWEGMLSLEKGEDMRCPYCLEEFQTKEIKWVATSPELRPDPLLGADHFLRFTPNASNMMPDGTIMDHMGSVCTQTACPKCHQILPYELVAALTDNPYAPA